MILLGRSWTTHWPKYLVLITGPRQINSIDFDISDTNHLYSGSELEIARLSSTWIGMVKRRCSAERGREIEGCGGDVHLPMKTA